jgi:hypothetical protein
MTQDIIYGTEGDVLVKRSKMLVPTAASDPYDLSKQTNGKARLRTRSDFAERLPATA